MIERLLPSAVVAVETFADDPPGAAFAGEEDLVAHAVAGRRGEFVTARRCARDALARLGHPPVPIRSGPRREPVWPAGVVGSITHCAGYRAAAVARATTAASVGIDAEPHVPLPAGIAGSVMTDAEGAMLAGLAAARPGTCWDTVLFSAKESVFKAWYPVTGRWLDFTDAELTIDPVAARFAATLPGDRPARATFRGRFMVDRGLVLTAVVNMHSMCSMF